MNKAFQLMYVAITVIVMVIFSLLSIAISLLLMIGSGTEADIGPTDIVIPLIIALGFASLALWGSVVFILRLGK